MPDHVPCAIIPGLRYRDCPAAIEWLCNVFGFQKKSVYMSKEGNLVDHAELTLGNGMIMLGSAQNQTAFSSYVAMPDEVGGKETRSAYIVVSDAEIAGIYTRAKAARAEMIFDLEKKDYGGTGFTCRDLEGHIWSIGTYNPWA